MNDDDADQIVSDGMPKLKGAEFIGKFGGYSSRGLIINDCHVVGHKGGTF